MSEDTCELRFTNMYTYFLSTVSLENVLLDVRELGKGMDLIRRECSLHDHLVLKGFMQASDAQLDKLQKDSKTAEVSQHCPPDLKGKKKSLKIDLCSTSLTSSTDPFMTAQCLHTWLPLWHCPPSQF